MSAIRERTVLCVIDLPKKLTSRRNLLAHFSKFGDITEVSVNKELRSGIIHFSSHFEAQSAKTQGHIYEDETLKIFWSESSAKLKLDPRAREKQNYSAAETDTLWQDDDKECFGIETDHSNLQEERKLSAKDMIRQHLMLPGVKKKILINTKRDEVNKPEISPIKLNKAGPKTQILLKKSLLTHAGKRKLVRKQGEVVRSCNNKEKKVVVFQNKSVKPTISSVIEQTDLKHKLALLDERDKLIRKETVQNSNIKTAIAIKGTCPDMCPERERILRQCGHAVAIYEMLPGTNEMDENRAVKEYIRSSADQDVPLPHDLRPEPILSMTMTYLITNIINRVDDVNENKAVWYSFCWNRLRSVRKDIILQQLCDMETVTIVEQCARFHISCYDHMWGAEVSGFDDKINTQNLIDCLQTLKHMYEDLAKHGVACPNEPEFYSYLILLTLNSNDVMWEYQQYSLELQLSPPVQFAIEAYMAYKNNMYSRYFNLVKKASYLTACLMQRYFDKLRTQALKTMLKAYCLPGKNMGLSSSFIMSTLKFDSQKNTLRFCERKELEVKVDFDSIEEDIYITTSSFLIREKRLPIAKAVVGENNPLPIYVAHQVHSSFDECGRLKNPFSVVSDKETAPNVSEEPLYSDDEKLDDHISQDVVEQPTFKFSLSPTKLPENSFSTSFLFNQESLNHNKFSIGNVIENEITENNILKQEVTITVNKSPNKSHGDRVADPLKIEHDLEEDMVYEESKVEDQKSSKLQFIDLPDTAQQPFLIPSLAATVKSSPLLTDKENKPQRYAHDNYFHLKYSQSKNVSLNNTEKIKVLTNIPKTEMSSLLPQNESGGLFKFDIFKQPKQPEKQDLPEQAGTNIERRISQNEFKQTPFNEYTQEISVGKKSQSTTKDIEAINKLLFEKLLREKAEEERIKMEEIKRVEIEQQRKKMEEQRVLQSLKKDLSNRLKAISARKCIRHWKYKVEKLKQTRADFPMLIQLPVNKYLSFWGSVDFVTSDSIYQRATDKKISTRVIKDVLKSGLSNSCSYIGSDLAEILAKSAVKTMKNVTRSIYWKLAVSVPWANKKISDMSVFNQLMRRWCTQSFYKDPNAVLGSVESVLTSIDILVNISIHFSDDLQSSHTLQGVDALLFVVLNESELDKTCLQRLRSLVTCQIKSEEFSVAVLNVGGNKLERVLRMELEELHEQNLVAHWSVNNWLNFKSILDGLYFLADHICVVPHICATPLDVLVKQVTEEFFDALNSGQHSCGSLKDAVKIPNIVIYLFNTCLTKLEDLLLSSKLEKYFRFAEEFKTYVPLNESGGPELMCGKEYNDLYKYHISKKIMSLKLAELNNWPPKSPNRLLKILKTYCAEVHDVSIFPQIIRMLNLPDDCSLSEHLSQISWLNIVEIWSQCKIRHCFPRKEKNKRVFVMFNKHDVQRIITKQWWLKLPLVVQLNK